MSWLLPASALFPLLLAAPAALPGMRRHCLPLLPLACLPALAAALLLPEGTAFSLPRVLMGVGWRLDTTARIFLLFTTFTWLMAALYAMPAFEQHPRRATFAIPFLIAMSGNFLLIPATDAIGFYTGFTMMSFAAWGLIVHDGNAKALQAGRVYLTIVLLGEFLVLPGLIKGTLWSGSTSLDAIRAQWVLDANPTFALTLIACGFGLKAGLFPLHIWLPLAHPAAPTPASAVLSGCMIKTALLAWLRLLPLGDLSMPVLGHILATLATIGMIGGLVAALFQSGAKALLAYTSLSKIGLMILLLSAAMVEPRLAEPSITAVLFLAAFHALHKGALFLGVGVTPAMGKAGGALLMLLAASYMGVPLLSGALSKDFLKALLDPALQPWNQFFGILLLIETMLAPAVFVRFVRMTRPAGSTARRPNPGGEAVWTLATLTAVSLPLLLIAQGAGALLPVPPVKAYVTGDPGFWIGAALTALMVVAGVHTSLRVPPGDVYRLFSRPSPHLRLRAGQWLTRVEQQLNRAPGGVAFLTVLLLLLALLLSSLS